MAENDWESIKSVESIQLSYVHPLKCPSPRNAIRTHRCPARGFVECHAVCLIIQISLTHEKLEKMWLNKFNTYKLRERGREREGERKEYLSNFASL